MIKIPEQVRIGGVDYKVDAMPNLRRGSGLLYGEISFDECCIHLSQTDGAGSERQKITLLHEILHGILWHYWSGEEIEQEEELVTALSKGLFQVLKDNEESLFEETGKKIAEM